MSIVCGSCKDKGYSGTTVHGALEEAENYYRRGRYEEAKRCYQKALNILDFHGGCRSCKDAIEREIDKC